MPLNNKFPILGTVNYGHPALADRPTGGQWGISNRGDRHHVGSKLDRPAFLTVTPSHELRKLLIRKAW